MYGSHIGVLGVSPPLPPRGRGHLSFVAALALGFGSLVFLSSSLQRSTGITNVHYHAPSFMRVLRICSRALCSVTPSALQILFLDIVSWSPEAGLELLILLSLSPSTRIHAQLHCFLRIQLWNSYGSTISARTCYLIPEFIVKALNVK